MASFMVSVGDKQYTLEFVRDSVRQFESLGGNVEDMKNKIYTTIDNLFYCGLRKHHRNINFTESKKISDQAIEEYGASEVYPILVENFSEVYLGEVETKGKKSFLVSKVTKATK